MKTAIYDSFNFYDQKFCQAMATMPGRRPWIDAEREEILSLSQSLLGIKNEWIPQTRAESVSLARQGDFHIHQLQAVAWEGVGAAADLYLPDRPGKSSLPIVLLACGHGNGGKRNSAYRRMASSLAAHGFAVLVPDNIGQGERTAMGHRDAVQVFEAGLSLQGLIIMETMAWLDWIKAQPQFDRDSIALIGNSGGGLLALFLGALRRDDLAAISSSGYPNSFEFIARKEKKHCHCNILPGIVGELEMWQIYGAIAPKPLFLFQGASDSLFPEDLFHRNARQVATAYELSGVADCFRAEVHPGGHSWDEHRMHVLTKHLCEHFRMPFAQEKMVAEADLVDLPLCFANDSFQSINTGEIASALTGNGQLSTQHLWDVFPPQSPVDFPGNSAYVRGDVKQIFAQFEAFLKK
jgi:dienelactone hydrolase